MATGKQQGMTITGGSGLSKDEIDRMMKDAEAHAEEDRRRRDEAEVRNSAEALQFSTEKFLTENGEKLPGDKKDELQQALDQLKSSLNGADIEAIKTAQERVSKAASDAGGAMYAAASGAEGAATDGTATGQATDADDSVVDAEVVDEGPEENK
jgi:molecular chaperone DnaK